MNGLKPQVALRNVIEADLQSFFEHQRDNEARLMAAFTRPDPDDWAAFNAHWQRILADPTVLMQTILVGSKVAGSIGSYIDPELSTREVTYWIAREDWGKGIATVALLRFLEIQQLRPLLARVAKDNARSRKVLENCGFILWQESSGYSESRGQEVAELVMRLNE